jgi:hypothetical protein
MKVNQRFERTCPSPWRRIRKARNQRESRWKVQQYACRNFGNGRGNSLSWPRNTIYPQMLALTSLTSGGRSVGIVRLRAKATEFSFYRKQEGNGRRQISSHWLARRTEWATMMWRRWNPVKREIYWEILKGPDDGVSHSELLGFWTFSIVRYSRN